MVAPPLMWNRRKFLRNAAALVPVHFLLGATGDQTGFQAHWIRKGGGKGQWMLRPAELQFLHGDGGGGIKPFGLAQMDNGELILAASWDDGSEAKSAADREKPVMSFSRDAGRTWSPFAIAANAKGRPVMFTDAGKGSLFFQTDLTGRIHQFFSSDYGRSWQDGGILQRPALDGSFNGIDGYFGGEGNALVEHRAASNRISVIGYTYRKGTSFPADPAIGMLRWSDDGGHTWSKEMTPATWLWQDSYENKTYTRGISEGALVRAANGWLVAALRTDMSYRFVNLHNDNMEGIAVSISKDDGATWSPLHVLYQGGRMHANLLRMPDGLLVMTYIVRQDYDGLRRASYRRGCEALISRDHGRTWNTAAKYVLDEFEYSDGSPLSLACGHLASTLAGDGFILTAYGNYLAKAAVLIRWKPWE